jgi:hypothetical protein
MSGAPLCNGTAPPSSECLEINVVDVDVLLCNQTALLNYTNFECVELGLRVFHGVILALLLALSLAGHFMVFILVYLHRELRERSVLASLGLVMADLIMIVQWVFQGEVSTIAGEWPFGDMGCSVFAYFYVSILLVRWGEILTVTNDRICEIFFPFWYKRFGKMLLVTMTILSWVIPGVVTIPVTALGLTDYYLAFSACSVNCGTNRACANGVTAMFGFYVTIGGVVPTIMYVTAYLYGWKKKRDAKRSLKMGTGEGIPSNNKKGFSYWSPQQRRAMFTCFLVFVTIVITNIPIYITSALRSTPEIYGYIPLWAHYLVTYFFLLGAVLDPQLVMRTKNFRKALKRTICTRREMTNGVIPSALRNVMVLGMITRDKSETTETTLSSNNTDDT